MHRLFSCGLQHVTTTMHSAVAALPSTVSLCRWSHCLGRHSEVRWSASIAWAFFPSQYATLPGRLSATLSDTDAGCKLAPGLTLHAAAMPCPSKFAFRTRLHSFRAVTQGCSAVLQPSSCSCPPSVHPRQTAVVPGGTGIRLAGATNSVHIMDVRTGLWQKVNPQGEPPSPRAAHAAAAVGTMVVVQVCRSSRSQHCGHF